MLFNELQATLQDNYQDVQKQIEALQEVQKQILDKMQSVGSVESEIEGALALLAKGLRHAKEVCPEQIDRIKQINLNLYDQETPALPEIEGTVKENDDPDLDTDPDGFDGVTIGAVIVTPEEIKGALDGDPEFRIVVPVSEVEDSQEVEVDQEVEQPQEVEVEVEVMATVEDLTQALSFQQLRKLAKDKGINAGGKADAIAKRLQGSVGATELARLQAQ